ncbi:MAG: PRD domain-containing protein [Propioniciclava sp.]
MRIVRAYNNNVVLAVDDEGDQFVVLGRGIGWKSHPGDRIDPDRVERTFVPEADSTRVAHLVAQIPAEHIALADAVVAFARTELGDHISARMLIPLADHISFVLRRLDEGMLLEYPLEWEVTHLYAEEARVGRQALALIEERTGTTLPRGEVSLLALHFVNARFAPAEATRTVRFTRIMAQVVEIIEHAYGFTVPENSLSLTRFLTHLRYLVTRIEKGDAVGQAPRGLLASVRRENPREYACAQRIRLLLELRLDTPIVDDEALYLALHVARLVGDQR